MHHALAELFINFFIMLRLVKEVFVFIKFVIKLQEESAFVLG